MATDRPGLTALPAWHALEAHGGQMRELHLRSLFASDPSRGERLVVEAAGLFLDYSKNRITGETVRLLVGLADACLQRAGLLHHPSGHARRAGRHVLQGAWKQDSRNDEFMNAIAHVAHILRAHPLRRLPKALLFPCTNDPVGPARILVPVVTGLGQSAR